MREVKSLDDHAVLVRAHVGMIPPNGRKIDPSKNAVQAMIACVSETGLAISLFQNTPAQYHGRPEAVEALTDELQRAADNGITIERI